MNHSKKHSSLQGQQERHDGMIQRRTTVTREELPMVPMFPVFVAAAEPEKTAPAPDPGPRFGIWSDGTLALRVKAGFFELESDEFAALLAFVDRMRDGRAA